MRVMRESSWGKLINNQVTRWVGSRQIDTRARGTQKTRTEATCSHKTETQAHGQQTNHQPCAKQDMNTQLMRKLISHVFTQDMTTWKHAANEYTSCVPHSTRYNKCTQPIETRTACNTTKHVDKSARCRANSRPRTHSDRKWSASVRTPSRDRNSRQSAGIQTPRSNMKQGTQTRECVSHENADMMGVSGLCHKPWITLDRSDRTLTLLTVYCLLFFNDSIACGWCPFIIWNKNGCFSFT